MSKWPCNDQGERINASFKCDIKFCSSHLTTRFGRTTEDADAAGWSIYRYTQYCPDHKYGSVDVSPALADAKEWFDQTGVETVGDMKGPPPWNVHAVWTDDGPVFEQSALDARTDQVDE